MAKRVVKLSGRNKTILSDYEVAVWEGLNTYIKDPTDLSDGQSPDSLNWLTSKFKDNISLRRGYALLGSNRRSGLGRISGLEVGVMENGTQVPFFTYGQKINYYNVANNTTVEINTTNIMPAAAANDDVSVMPYENLAGAWIYFTSPNSSIYKISPAFPGDATDLQSTSFRGIAKIDQNCMFMWQRNDSANQKYPNILYAGVSDQTALSQYTQTTKETHGTGDGTTTSFTGTLSLGQIQSAPVTTAKSNKTAFYTQFYAPIGAGLTIVGITPPTVFTTIFLGQIVSGINVGDAITMSGVGGMTQINNILGFVEAVSAGGTIDQQSTLINGTIHLGDNTKQNVAQAFTPQNNNDNIAQIVFQRGANVGTPAANVVISIQTDNSNKPSGTVVNSVTYTAAQWAALPVGSDITVPLPASCTANNKYWIVFTPSAQDASNYMTLQYDTASTYTGGNAATENGTTWTVLSNTCLYFKIIEGGYITTSINSSAFSSYTSGGTLYRAEAFYDDQNGNLASILGGTGTINYTTGAFTLNFADAPTSGQTIYAQYYSEDATNGGVADFTINGTVAGEGKTFTQSDGGGAIQGVYPFDQVEYCFHLLKSWYLTMTGNDTQASNLPYRSNLGIPYFRGAYPTDDGVVFIDTSNPNLPKVKILEIDNNSATAVVTVVPNEISQTLDLSGYGFNQAVMFRWGDYDLLSCSNSLNGIVQPENTVTYVRNIYTGLWDLTDYAVSAFAKYYGTLLAGDSLSDNVYTLFSGFDDDGSLIDNHYTTKMYDLGVEGIKRFYRFVIRGLIQSTQNIDIYFSFDSGDFVKYATVQGNASYVNTGQEVTIGSQTQGSGVIGGGGSPVTAYPFEVEFTIASDRFEYVQAMFEANNIGYAQIDNFIFKDNRYYGKRVTPARTITY